ncbi:MAG: FHA domain-containing protein [Xenococcaceae cyanobacterium]
MNNSLQFRHRLVIEAPKYKRTVYLQATTYSVGRHPSNSIVIHSQCVSRYHATLLCLKSPDNDDNLFCIIDGNLKGQRSKNGIFVNDKRRLSIKLKHGDIIVIGDIKIFYYIEDSRVFDESTAGKFEEEFACSTNSKNQHKITTMIMA